MSWIVVAPLALLLGDVPTAPAPAPASADARPAYEAKRAAAGRDPDSQVALALWCEANGLAAERVKHLAIAVLSDPTHATARGLLGLIEYQGRWTRPEAVVDEIKSDADLARSISEYNRRRVGLRDRAADHHALALWCEKNGLESEAIAHFTAVTRLDPGNESAFKHLGYKRHGGAWMTAERAAAIEAETRAQHKANAYWSPLLDKYKTWLGRTAHRREARAKLDAVTDPRAVAAIWAIFARGDAPSQAIAVRLLGQVESPGASRALAILAVHADSDAVRREAAARLGQRDPRDVVDLLIAAIGKPIRFEVRPIDGPGSTGVLFIEGERSHARRVYQASYVSPFANVPPRLLATDIPVDTTRDGPKRPGKDQERIIANENVFVRDAAILRQEQANILTNQINLANAQRALAADVQSLNTINERIDRTNARIRPLLIALTGNDRGPEQAQWESWWTDQKGYALMTPEAVSSDIKPTYDINVPITVVAAPVLPVPGIRHSCFAAGTPVKTIDGLRPIEAIQVGDRLVVQDTKTGKLQFQPVVAVFRNPPAGTYRVKLEGETIVATGIHRFWVAGKGWTMARDLKPGETLRTLDGTARVIALEPDRVQPVFNLEVASGRSYFVGTAAALVHDNSLVEATPEPFDAPNRRPVAKD